MQAVEYVQSNGYAILKSSFETVKEFGFDFVTDILKDLGEIIKAKSDAQIKEIQVYSQIVRGSIVGLVSSVALVVIGNVIGSSLLVAVGTFGRDISLISGFIGLAGQCTNLISKSYGIKTNDLGEKV